MDFATWFEMWDYRTITVVNQFSISSMVSPILLESAGSVRSWTSQTGEEAGQRWPNRWTSPRVVMGSVSRRTEAFWQAWDWNRPAWVGVGSQYIHACTVSSHCFFLFCIHHYLSLSISFSVSQALLPVLPPKNPFLSRLLFCPHISPSVFFLPNSLSLSTPLLFLNLSAIPLTLHWILLSSMDAHEFMDFCIGGSFLKGPNDFPACCVEYRAWRSKEGFKGQTTVLLWSNSSNKAKKSNRNMYCRWKDVLEAEWNNPWCMATCRQISGC